MTPQDHLWTVGLLCLTAGQWIVLRVAEYHWRKERERWERERSDLLARIQSHTPSEYMAYRRAESASVEPPSKVEQEKQADMEKYASSPDVDVGAAMSAATQLMGG